MSEQQTRDLAVAASTKIDAHVQECTELRKRIEKALDDFRLDLKKINWRMAMMVGGLLTLSHVVDWLVKLTGHP